MAEVNVVRVALVSSLSTLLMVLVVGGGGYWFYTAYGAGWVRQYQIAHESKSILAEVGKAVYLPEDETPQVAKILNADELKDSDTFFASAKNGDAAVYYEKSGLIILFDLTSHKLLNMGTLAEADRGAVSGASSGGLQFKQ